MNELYQEIKTYGIKDIEIITGPWPWLYKAKTPKSNVKITIRFRHDWIIIYKEGDNIITGPWPDDDIFTGKVTPELWNKAKQKYPKDCNLDKLPVETFEYMIQQLLKN